MPRRDKKKRKRTKKTKLSTEEILMLLKKLKPKTSQNVRVNVGDAKGGKSSYTPPFVVPQQQPSVSYTFAGQPLSALATPPTQITEPTAIPIVPKKPVERKPKKVVAMATSLTDTEAEIMNKSFYYDRNPFKEPPQNRSGNLSSNVSAYARMQPSNQYTQYPIIDLSQPDSDNSGTSPDALPQDQWTGSPDGTSVPFNEMEQQQAPLVNAGYEPTPQEAFASEEVQPILQTPVKKKNPPPETPATELNPIMIRTAEQKLGFVNHYIAQDIKAPLPKEYLVSRGARKGFVKSGLSTEQLNYLYNITKEKLIELNQM